MKKRYSRAAGFLALLLAVLLAGCSKAPAGSGSGTAVPTGSGGQVTPADPGKQETPTEPAGQDTPAEPDDPETPGESELPELPDEPEVPEEPDEPEVPDTPTEPETPDTPAGPEEPETPSEPELPEEPPAPQEPEEPEEPSGELPLVPVGHEIPVIPGTLDNPIGQDTPGGDVQQLGSAGALAASWLKSVQATYPTETKIRIDPDLALSLRDYTGRMARSLLAGNGENKVFSPLNIYLALGMLAECADEQGQQELLALLGVDTIEQLREMAPALWRAAYQNREEAKSLLGASLWLREDGDYSQEVMDRLAAYYYASSFWGEMGSEEYNQVLRDWLNAHTGGLLEDQANGLSLDRQTAAALLTTIYLKAQWSNEFGKNQTTTDTFHSPKGDREAEFMHATRKHNTYWQGAHYTAVCLDLQYAGSVWLVLPEEGLSPADLLEDPEALSFLSYPKDAERRRCTVVYSIPKFDVECQTDLIAELKKLGVKSVFAPFDSPLTDTAPLYVSQVTHGARFTADEEGVEGAAYTMIMMAFTSAGPEPQEETVYFTADRPFFFVVTTPGGLVTFMGVVNEPKAFA